jgi:transcriptional regulator with XRE-family HTH domain
VAKTTFGQRLRKLRQSHPVQKVGLTQTELAAMAGVSSQQINNWESDKNEPTIASVRKLAEALGIEISELVG